MATELITRTWCDLCIELLAPELKAEGTTWRFGINPPGERWTWVEIDLCPDHVSTNFADMHEVLTKYGREGDQPARRGRPPSSEVFTCPECGKETATKNGLGVHLSRMHGVAGAAR